MTPLESFCFWGSKVFYALYMLVLPAVYSPHPAWKIGLLYIVSQVHGLLSLEDVQQHLVHDTFKNKANGRLFTANCAKGPSLCILYMQASTQRHKLGEDEVLTSMLEKWPTFDLRFYLDCMLHIIRLPMACK
jgi:hypothetical protein